MEQGQEQPQPRYWVDPDWYDENQRSFPLTVQSRMCVSCRKRIGEEEEISISTFDGKRGRVVFKTVKQRYGDDPLAIIADCCSKKEGYLPARLPLAETVFRLFLAQGNPPLSAEEVCQHTKQALPDDHRDISVPVLQRLLVKDQAYGFRTVPWASTPEG